MPIQCGVSQGSGLRPLLFIMYINVLLLAVKACSIEIYADDTLLFFADQSVSEIESRLLTDLDRLISWFRCIYFMLTVSKTQILLIGTTRGLALAADNTILERVDTFKYLGVTMDETLSGKRTLAC